MGVIEEGAAEQRCGRGEGTNHVRHLGKEPSAERNLGQSPKESTLLVCLTKGLVWLVQDGDLRGRARTVPGADTRRDHLGGLVVGVCQLTFSEMDGCWSILILKNIIIEKFQIHKSHKTRIINFHVSIIQIEHYLLMASPIPSIYLFTSPLCIIFFSFFY